MDHDDSLPLDHRPDFQAALLTWGAKPKLMVDGEIFYDPTNLFPKHNFGRDVVRYCERVEYYRKNKRYFVSARGLISLAFGKKVHHMMAFVLAAVSVAPPRAAPDQASRTAESTAEGDSPNPQLEVEELSDPEDLPGEPITPSSFALWGPTGVPPRQHRPLPIPAPPTLISSAEHDYAEADGYLNIGGPHVRPTPAATAAGSKRPLPDGDEMPPTKRERHY